MHKYLPNPLRFATGNASYTDSNSLYNKAEGAATFPPGFSSGFHLEKGFL